MRGSGRNYFGVTRLRASEAIGAAQARRCRAHIRSPVAWLRPMQEHSLALAALGCGMKSKRVLVREAMLTAQAWQVVPNATRGGPWVLPTLSPRDQTELQLIASASSEAPIHAAAKTCDLGGGLRRHLAGQCFHWGKPCHYASSCASLCGGSTGQQGAVGGCLPDHKRSRLGHAPMARKARVARVARCARWAR